MITKEPPSTDPGVHAKPTWLSLIARPLIIIALLGIIVFVLYPVAAEVLGGLGIRLPRW